MGGWFGRVTEFHDRHIDPKASRLANIGGAAIVLGVLWAVATDAWGVVSDLSERIGTTNLVVGSAILLLAVAVVVLAVLLWRERRTTSPPDPEPVSTTPEPGPTPTASQRDEPARSGDPDRQRPVVRQTPQLRDAFTDRGFGEELQRLYNEGYELEQACQSPFQRTTMGMLTAGRPTDEADVRSWANQVDAALQGRAKLRAKFAHAGGEPSNLWASFSTTMFRDPLKEELGRRLKALETIIQSL